MTFRAVLANGELLGVRVRATDEDGNTFTGRVEGVEHGGLGGEKVKLIVAVGSSRAYLRLSRGAEMELLDVPGQSAVRRAGQ